MNNNTTSAASQSAREGITIVGVAVFIRNIYRQSRIDHLSGLSGSLGRAVTGAAEYYLASVC